MLCFVHQTGSIDELCCPVMNFAAPLRKEIQVLTAF